jgi:hypothetical protein
VESHSLTRQPVFFAIANHQELLLCRVTSRVIPGWNRPPRTYKANGQFPRLPLRREPTVLFLAALLSLEPSLSPTRPWLPTTLLLPTRRRTTPPTRKVCPRLGARLLTTALSPRRRRLAAGLRLLRRWGSLLSRLVLHPILAVWLRTDIVAIFVISVFGLHARGVQSPNVMVGVLLFFGGLSQFVAGIMEFVTGNTVRSIRTTATLQATSELTRK